MIFLSGRIRVLLVMLSGALVMFGAVALVTWETLPYGVYVAIAGGVSLCLSLLPARTFLRLRKYGHELETPAPNAMTPANVPVKEGYTYLARGFSWRSEHVERLSDLALAGREMPEEVTEQLQGNWHLHGVGADTTKDLFLPNNVFQQHTLIVGTTGTGKSRQIELLAHQAVARGDSVVILDPKPDERLMDRVFDSCTNSGREGDWRLFALPYPYDSVQYNPVANYARPSEVPDRISLVLPRGSGDAEAFRNFAWEFVNTVTAALDALGETITISKLQRFCLFEDKQKDLVRKLILRFAREVDLNIPVGYEEAVATYLDYSSRTGKAFAELDAMIGMASRDRNYFDKLSSALRPLFAKLTAKGIGYLLNPGEMNAPGDVERPVGPTEISWEKIHQNAQVVYMNLGSMMGPDTAQGVARMVLADLQSYIGKLYAYKKVEALQKRRLVVIIDELKDALSPNSINLLNKARGAGLSLVLAGQSIADLESALESRTEARRALANLGTILCYRLASSEDVDYFSDICGDRPIRTRTESHSYEPALFSSGNTFIDDFTFNYTRAFATRSDRLVPDAVVNQLPTGHALIKSGGLIYKAYAPLLSEPAHLISLMLKDKKHLWDSQMARQTADPMEKEVIR